MIDIDIVKLIRRIDIDIIRLIIFILIRIEISQLYIIVTKKLILYRNSKNIRGFISNIDIIIIINE